jgi:hypothetical protein
MATSACRITATGQTRELLGRRCLEHTVDVSVTLAPAGQDRITVVMRGPVWIAPDSPGKEDLGRFYDAAVEKGLSFMDPRAVKADPGRAKGMTSLYRELTARGVPYSTQLDISVDGTGAMAGILKKMGTASMSNEVTAISTDPLSDDLFTVPAGYETKKK